MILQSDRELHSSRASVVADADSPANVIAIARVGRAKVPYRIW